MNEKLLLLKASLDNGEKEIVLIYTALVQREQNSLVGQDKAILLGYYLHNLYTAFENAFKTIASTFENEIRDASQWHAELLRRMTLDIPGLRPRFVSPEAYDLLDELRRFRHVFRSAYTMTLDLERLAVVLKKAHELERIYPQDFKHFGDFLTLTIQE
jgi:hypothetical protein